MIFNKEQKEILDNLMSSGGHSEETVLDVKNMAGEKVSEEKFIMVHLQHCSARRRKVRCARNFYDYLIKKGFFRRVGAKQ
jgi:hypothetical protein